MDRARAAAFGATRSGTETDVEADEEAAQFAASFAAADACRSLEAGMAAMSQLWSMDMLPRSTSVSNSGFTGSQLAGSEAVAQRSGRQPPRPNRLGGAYRRSTAGSSFGGLESVNGSVASVAGARSRPSTGQRRSRRNPKLTPRLSADHWGGSVSQPASRPGSSSASRVPSRPRTATGVIARRQTGSVTGRDAPNDSEFGGLRSRARSIGSFGPQSATRSRRASRQSATTDAHASTQRGHRRRSQLRKTLDSAKNRGRTPRHAMADPLGTPLVGLVPRQVRPLDSLSDPTTGSPGPAPVELADAARSALAKLSRRSRQAGSPKSSISPGRRTRFSDGPGQSESPEHELGDGSFVHQERTHPYTLKAGAPEFVKRHNADAGIVSGASAVDSLGEAVASQRMEGVFYLATPRKLPQEHGAFSSGDESEDADTVGDSDDAMDVGMDASTTYSRRMDLFKHQSEFLGPYRNMGRLKNMEARAVDTVDRVLQQAEVIRGHKKLVFGRGELSITEAVDEKIKEASHHLDGSVVSRSSALSGIVDASESFSLEQRSLLGSMSQHSTGSQVRLGHYGLGDELGNAVASSLRKMPSLQSIDMRGNRMSDTSLASAVGAMVTRETMVNRARGARAAAALGSTERPALRAIRDMARKKANKPPKDLAMRASLRVAMAAASWRNRARQRTAASDSDEEVDGGLKTHAIKVVKQGSSSSDSTSASEDSETEKHHGNFSRSDLGGMALASHIRDRTESHVHGITSLDLSYNQLHHRGAEALARLFDTGRQFKVLLLSNCSLVDTHGAVLIKPLETMHGLLSLDLSRNQLSGVAAGHLANLIRIGNLQELNLSWNNLRTGLEHIADAVASNDSLVSLSLSCNNLRGAPVEQLAQALQEHEHLKHLDISHNIIEGAEAMSLAHAFGTSRSMVSLNISGNAIGRHGARAFLRALQKPGPLAQEADRTHPEDIVFDGRILRRVQLRGCSMQLEEISLVDIEEPSGVYRFDLHRVYDRFILVDLMEAASRRKGMQFADVVYTGPDGRERNLVACRRAADEDEKLAIFGVPGSYDEVDASAWHDGMLYFGASTTSSPWQIPPGGTISFTIRCRQHVPKQWEALSDASFQAVHEAILDQISENVDKTNLLDVMTDDLLLTCKHVEQLIGSTIVRGYLEEDAVLVLSRLLCRVVDHRNVVDFLRRRLSLMGRVELQKRMGAMINLIVSNPTGHYHLNLSNPGDRATAVRLFQVNTTERESRILLCRAAESASGGNPDATLDQLPGDTSQNGNWDNVRNITLDRRPMTISSDFAERVPRSGTLDFDYVSTTRPPRNSEVATDTMVHELCRTAGLLPKPYVPPVKDPTQVGMQALRKKMMAESVIFLAKHKKLGSAADDPSSAVSKLRNTSLMMAASRSYRDYAAGTLVPGGDGDDQEVAATNLLVEIGDGMALTQHGYSNCDDDSAVPPRARSPSGRRLRVSKESPQEIRFDDEDAWPELQPDATVPKNKWVREVLNPILAEMNQLVAGYVFTARQMWRMIGLLPKHLTFSRVNLACILFGRIVDLENLWISASDYLTGAEVLSLVRRLGWLNILNPLAVDVRYDLNLSLPDHRRMARFLTKLAVVEPGENWINVAFDDKVGWVLPMSWTELIPETGRLQLQYVSKGSGCKPDWKCRIKLANMFLVGTAAAERNFKRNIAPTLKGKRK